MRNIKYEEDYGVTPERSKELIKRDEERHQIIIKAIEKARKELLDKLNKEG